MIEDRSFQIETSGNLCGPKQSSLRPDRYHNFVGQYCLSTNVEKFHLYHIPHLDIAAICLSHPNALRGSNINNALPDHDHQRSAHRSTLLPSSMVRYRFSCDHIAKIFVDVSIVVGRVATSTRIAPGARS